MRYLPLTHTVLACFLWCAVVFGFVGHVFTSYDIAAQKLRDARVQTGLADLKAMFQAEMDKGATLPQLKKIQSQFSRYMEDDASVLSLLVFDYNSGKILFSSALAQIGIEVPVQWRDQCRIPGTFFVEIQDKKETIGTPVFNAFNENAGCLVAEYKTAPSESVREQMVQTAFHASVRFCIVGVLALFFIYLYRVFYNKLPAKKVYRVGFLMVGFAALILILPSMASKMYASFEKDLKTPIALKAKIVSHIVKYSAQKSVESGIPYTSLASVEPFLEQIRKKNPEVMFILLTDKSGRVLFESGTAAEAFDSDPHTGKITLRKGYFNVAEQINANDVAVGWVQIGINERFVRESLF